MVNAIVNIKRIIDKYNKDEITVYAAQASFFIVLSAFPFIMLLLSIVQMIPNLSWTAVRAIVMTMTPQILHSLIVTLFDDIFTDSPGVAISFSALVTLWSASRGMFSIKRGLDRIHATKERQGYIVRRIICIGYTLVFIVVCVVSLLLLVFGNGIQNMISRTFPLIARVTGHIISFRALLALALLIVSFTGLYSFLPKKKLKMRRQLPGAVLSTIGWIGFSYLFSIYFDHFGNYSRIYGSLTAIILLMLWLYVCICIIFMGAEINYYYEHTFLPTHRKRKTHSENNGVDR